MYCSQLLYLKDYVRGASDCIGFKYKWDLKQPGTCLQNGMGRDKTDCLYAILNSQEKVPKYCIGIFSFQDQTNTSLKSSQKKSYVSPVTQYSDHATQEKVSSKNQRYSPVSYINKFFSHCTLCKWKQNNKILDCDAIISMESNIAYAVYFRLPRQNGTQPTKSKSPKERKRKKKDEMI